MARKREPEPTPEPDAEEAQPLERNHPAHVVRIGRLRAVVWLNEGDQGPWFSTVFHRTYKQGAEYKTAHTYGRDDLLVLAEISRLAWLWIASQSGAQGIDSQVDQGGDTHF